MYTKSTPQRNGARERRYRILDRDGRETVIILRRVTVGADRPPVPRSIDAAHTQTDRGGHAS